MSSLSRLPALAARFDWHVRKGFAFLSLLAVFVLVASRAAFAELPLKYMPDGTNMLISVNFQEIHDSSFYQNLKKDLPDFAKGEQSFADEAGMSTDDLARVTMAGNVAGKGPEGQPTVIFQTRRAVTPEQVRGAMKAKDYQKDFKIDEIKVGQYTIYDPSYHFKFEPPGSKAFHGEAFVVVENNVVLESRNIDGMRAILQRGRPGELSGTMDGLLKGADDGKTLVYALDLKGVAADEDFMKSLQRQFGPLLGASGDILKHIDSLAADASLKDADGVLRDFGLQGRAGRGRRQDCGRCRAGHAAQSGRGVGSCAARHC